MEFDELLLGLLAFVVVFSGPAMVVIGFFIGGWGLLMSLVGAVWWMYLWGKLD